MMHEFFLWVSIAILATSLLCMIRVVFGPTVIDRIVGVNAIGTMTIAVVLFIGVFFEQVEFFIDIAFTYALINFMGTIALTKFFENKGVASEEEETG